IGTLARDERNSVVVVSGRDRATLTRWLGDLPISLIAEHGVWLQPKDGEWTTIEPMNDLWKERVRPVLEMFVDRTPGSFIEEKDFSLVWHYRASQPELAETRRVELRQALTGMLKDLGLAAMEGNKVVEVKRAEVNKGRAAHRWMSEEGVEFVLAIGDDRTDEDVFASAPSGAWTIKVGPGATEAGYSVKGVSDVRRLLARMTEVDQ
ncbi:MAG TPA: trehalose-phosphatase, partial [Coriobacteriia bacterium]|nr:trehalose-phosphatase [Coriobacteriia bacterium]